MSTLEKVKESVALAEQLNFDHELIVFNDDVNTFDHVIETLIKVCDHTPLQAEQCAILVHYTGKCTVKTGNYEKLKPLCTALLDAELSAEIQ